MISQFLQNIIARIIGSDICHCLQTATQVSSKQSSIVHQRRTADNHTTDVKVKGLVDAGGVAYLDKPFATRTLAAYIDRFVRERKKGSASASCDHIKQLGNLQFDIRNRALICENRVIKDLRPMEFSILKKLASHFNQFVSRTDLMATAWDGQELHYNEQSFNNYIRRLRNLLKNDTNLVIELSRQFGYKLEVESC